MEKKYILFDFDGVIADSFNLAFELNKILYPNLTEELFRKTLEGHSNDFRKIMLTHPGMEENVADFDFFKEYALRMQSEIEIVPGIKETLQRLKKRYCLIIISSTLTAPIKEFLKKNGLGDIFLDIFGLDIHKSKIEKFKIVLEKYAILPSNCLCITDTLGDILEASSLDIKSIGVTWGFHTPKTLLKGKPFRVVQKPREILEIASGYFKHIDN